MFDGNVKASWKVPLDAFFQSRIGKDLTHYLQTRAEAGAKIYPPNPLRALETCSLEEVKVVILGQDPYHGEHQANGLAFSVYPEVKIPPSLRNIFKEIQNEYPEAHFPNGDLSAWAAQGVLLLNAVFTVEEGKPGCHAKKGWETLSDRLIETVARENRPIVYMLWGNFAKKKREVIAKSNPAALILESNHPSPLSAMRGPEPFIGNGHFKKANIWLLKNKQEPIQWA